MSGFSTAFDPTSSQDDSSQAPAAPIPQADPATLQQAATGGVAQAEQAPPSGSRLGAIVQAVAKVASTALAGVPDRGRPSFLTGLGEGARSAQAVQANQQAIKFRNFDDQVRLAQLHNQDLKLQNDTQEQQDAHKKAELDNRALANSLGIDYDTIPSDGKTVMDHLTAQTAMNGAASVPAGTHLSGDGETINIPKDTQNTRDGQKQMYGMLGSALGLPSLPQGAQFVPDKNINMLTNKLHGFDLNGNPIKHDDLPSVIATEKTQRDQLAKNGASPQQLQAVDNVIAIHQANLDALDEHAAGVADATSKRKIAEKNAAIDEKARVTPQKPPKSQDNTELNAVAYDPNFQNPDGTKGGNVVMSKADAAAKGLSHYKADVGKINSLVAGFNDVQTKINAVADVANSPDAGTIQADVAASLLKDRGFEFGAHAGGLGFQLPTDIVNTKAYASDLAQANQATRNYVTALLGAREAITQLPRLQTFGQSSRMTHEQMLAAIKQLPVPGDDPVSMQQKLTALQGVLDPLRKQVPHMPGAEKIPSWLEQRK